MSKAPAFQFYPKDYESDEHVKLMTLEQEGAYIRLLCHAWLHGSVPGDISHLAVICRTNRARMQRIWPGVRACFTEREPGRLVNERLERERDKQSARKVERAEAGRKGAEERERRRQADTEAQHKLSISSASNQHEAKSSFAVASAVCFNEPWSKRIVDRWRTRCGGDPHPSLFKALKPIRDAHGDEALLLAFGSWLDNTEQKYLGKDASGFVTKFGHWLSQATLATVKAEAAKPTYPNETPAERYRREQRERAS